MAQQKKFKRIPTQKKEAQRDTSRLFFIARNDKREIQLCRNAIEREQIMQKMGRRETKSLMDRSNKLIEHFEARIRELRNG